MLPRIANIATRLRPVFEKQPAVDAVFLFGSHAEDRARPDSDLDLAVVGPKDKLAKKKLDLLAELIRAGFDRVDLVLLDEVGTVLQFEAVRHNCLVYSKPDFDRGSYYSLVVRQYFDFEPYLRTQREALKRRLLRDPA